MELPHQTHKLTEAGWLAALNDWRRSRTRRRIRSAQRCNAPAFSEISPSH